jgi:hypothetical protein
MRLCLKKGKRKRKNGFFDYNYKNLHYFKTNNQIRTKESNRKIRKYLHTVAETYLTQLKTKENFRIEFRIY